MKLIVAYVLCQSRQTSCFFFWLYYNYTWPPPSHIEAASELWQATKDWLSELWADSLSELN